MFRLCAVLSGGASDIAMNNAFTSFRFAFLLAIAIPCCGAPALDWKSEPGSRHAEVSVPKSGKPGFTLMPPSATGIYFSNILTDEKAAENQIRLIGSGIAAGDVDGD